MAIFFGRHYELIEAEYYQIDLYALHSRRFLNLVFAWLYNSMTSVTRQRMMDEWDKNLARVFADPVTGETLDPADLRREYGIKPAEPGKRATLKIQSKMPKMKAAELTARGEYLAANPDEAERISALTKDEKIEALKAWLEEYRSADDS